MKIYNSYIKKDKNGKIDDWLLLKDGFSFLAFIFGPLWFFYHKMWREALFITAFCYIIASSPFFIEANKFLVQIFFSFIVALNANYWYGLKLQLNNYKFLNLVKADNKEELLFVLKDQYKNSYFKSEESFSSNFLESRSDCNLTNKIINFFKKINYKNRDL